MTEDKPPDPALLSPAGVHWAAYLRSRGSEKLTAHTIRRYEMEFVAVAHLLGTPPAGVDLSDLTLPQLREAFALYATTRTRSTIAGTMSTWTKFCRWLVREELVTANPMDHLDRPKVPSPTPKALNGGAETVDRLIRSVRRGDRTGRAPWPERDLAVIAVYAGAGLRRAEAIALNVVDLDRDGDTARLRVTGKGGSGRWATLDAVMVDVFADYLTTRVARFPPRTRNGQLPGTAPLFVGDAGERFEPHQVYRLVRECYRAAGVLGQVPAGAMVHALRHTFATTLAEQGAAATDLQGLLGHASLATSQRYVSVTDDRLAAVAALSPVRASLRRAHRANRDQLPEETPA